MKKLLASRKFLAISACILVTLGLIAGGVYYRSSTSADTIKKVIATSTTTTTTTTSSTTTTTTLPPKPGQPAPSNIPLLNGESLGYGSDYPIVTSVEQRLADLKFDPGTIDTKFDKKTQYAVQSLQKYKGIPITSRITDAEITLLNTFQYEEPFAYPAEPNRFEISLDKQIAVLYENYNVRLITTTSTGNQKNYCYISKKTSRRTCAAANTPTGRFEFGRRYKGHEKGDLGELYNPVYFKGGIAVHGYDSVPTTPASHGCARIPMYISEYFQSLVTTGMPVYVVAAQPVAYSWNKVGDVVDTTPKTKPTTTVSTTPEPTTTTAPTDTTSSTLLPGP